MKRKAALIVCGILAASFAATGISDHRVVAGSNGKESAGSRATLTMSDELKENLAAQNAASTEDSSTSASGEDTETETAAGQKDAAEAKTGAEADAASTEEEEAGSAGREDSAAAKTENNAAEDASADSNNKEADGTSYFTVTEPEGWQDGVVTETEEPDGTDGDSAVYGISYYEKTAHDNEEGGLLVRLALYTSRKGYLSLPEYTYVGDLTAEDGTAYAVIAEFPSDVQFSMEAREQYEALSAQIPQLVRSVEGADGYTFHAGHTRLEQQAEESYSFAQILESFENTGMLPNSTEIDTSAAKSETNQFAILDADGDGAKELVLKIGSPAASDKVSRQSEAADSADGGTEDSAAAGTAAESKNEQTAVGETQAETGTAEGETADNGSSAAETEADTAETANAGFWNGFGWGSAGAGAAEGSSETQGTASAESSASGNSSSGEAASDSALDTSDDDYYDSYAASNYYVFKGDSSDSHAAHLTEEGLEEVLKNTTEEYIATAYDISWQNITKGSVNRLYAQAYVPVGESPERQEAQRRHAYKEAMQKLVDENTLPDGTKAISYEDNTAEDMDENHFAISDVNADGYDELLIRITNTAADSTRELVYAYDADKDALELQFDGVPGGVIYYDNGTIQAEARYDNNEPSRLWPYQLSSYNAETGTYENQGYVYAWDHDVMRQQQGRTVDALGAGFPAQADKDGNGRVYFLQDKTDGSENTDTDAVDDQVVEDWYSRVVGGSEALFIDWYTVTTDNISMALAK